MQRREFLGNVGQGTFAALATTAAGSLSQRAFAADAFSRPPRIVLRSSWQTVNIGDIAHTPGVLHLLEQHLPEAEVRLWPSSVDNGVAALLERRFPKLVICQGTQAIDAALAECDFLLHGSGPSLVAARDVTRWHRETGKPFGVFGVTLGTVDRPTIELLSAARFIYFRDSVSLALARQQGIQCGRMEFGPDGAFACDLLNDDAAAKFLEQNRLETGRFLCCIPRLRYTPYWKIKDRPFDEQKHARNEEMQEHDHAPLRAAIEAVVRQTELKVLLCPEDQSQMEVGRRMIYDRLPGDVRQRVVWREKYWLCDEALSTYRRSAGLFGLEMHSPIMCIGSGVPALVGRFAEQTSKGLMWRDIGLDNWLFDLDQDEQVARLVPTVLQLARDRDGSRKQAQAAQQRVADRQRQMVATLRAELKSLLSKS